MNILQNTKFNCFNPLLNYVQSDLRLFNQTLVYYDKFLFLYNKYLFFVIK